MDWLRNARPVTVMAFLVDGDSGVIISALGEVVGLCRIHAHGDRRVWWDAFHDITGETDAELTTRLMVALAITRQHDN